MNVVSRRWTSNDRLIVDAARRPYVSLVGGGMVFAPSGPNGTGDGSSSRAATSAALAASGPEIAGSLTVFDIRSRIVACRTQYSLLIIVWVSRPQARRIYSSARQLFRINVQKWTVLLNGQTNLGHR
jgi:hypothetical protein